MNFIPEIGILPWKNMEQDDALFIESKEIWCEQYSCFCELILFWGSEYKWNLTQNSDERKQEWVFAEKKQKRASW